jgi:Domain of unknown function (DUF4062)
MDKRYQVFVSSTFRDLLDERQAVTTALLEMDAIPAGMELFPASNDDAWNLIQRVIEQSDYYVLIVGGRYGSTDEAGIGYTEKEYDYAVKCGVPVLPFLHEHPENIPAGKTELADAAREKLAAFRDKVEKVHHCKYWNDPEQLGSRVTRGLMHQTKTMPRTGWVRGDQVGGAEALAELNRLRTQVDALNGELQKSRTEAPKGTEALLQGDDPVRLAFQCQAYDDEAVKTVEQGEYASTTGYLIKRELSVNDLFAGCGPVLLQDATEPAMSSAIDVRVHELLSQRDAWYRDHKARNPSIKEDSFQTIKVQLIALGLIKKSDRKRSAADKGNYWTLTPYGESTLIRLRAMRKTTSSGS